MSSSSGRQYTKRASDGSSYDVLSTGHDVEYEYVDYAKQDNLSTVGGYVVHHIYVECQEVKDKLLPIEANPREPSFSPVVGAMHDTLEHSPGRFVRRNNGMTIVCETIEEIEGENRVRLKFSDDDEGICNGGHTYYAIQTFERDFSNSGVHLEIIEIPEELEGANREDEIADIAQARNNINNLEDYTILDYLGCFDPLKGYLEDENVIVWHEGDSDAVVPKIPAKSLIRNMAVVDPLKYSHQILNSDASTHRNSALGYGDFNDWHDKALEWRSSGAAYPQKHMAPLLNDILEVKDMLAHSLKFDSDVGTFRSRSLWRDHLKDSERDLHFGRYAGEVGVKINATVEVMMLGMFRSNVYIHFNSGAEPVCIGWLQRPRDIWDDMKENILADLSEYYQSDGNLREFMNNPAPYKIQLYQFDSFATDYPYPAFIIYDIETGTRYERVEDEADATHWLGDDGLVSLSNRERPSTAPPYRQA